MKKLIVLLVALGILAGFASLSQAATAPAAKTAAPKKAAAKKVVKKVVKKAVKAAPQVVPVAPAPPPPPAAAPIAPPAPAAVTTAPAGPLFGWGINSAWTGTYLNTGKGRISGCLAAAGSVVLDDPFSLGSLVGLSSKAVKYRAGLGWLYGTTTAGGDRLKALPLFVDGVISLPAQIGGLETYLGGGLNYVVYGTGERAGNVGGEIYAGLSGDLGLGLGKTSVELGWAAFRAYQATAKGLTLSVCQPISL